MVPVLGVLFCHQLHIEMEVVVDDDLRVRDAHSIGRKVRRLVESIEDVDSADIHLELDDSKEPTAAAVLFACFHAYIYI